MIVFEAKKLADVHFVSSYFWICFLDFTKCPQVEETIIIVDKCVLSTVIGLFNFAHFYVVEEEVLFWLLFHAMPLILQLIFFLYKFCTTYWFFKCHFLSIKIILHDIKFWIRFFTYTNCSSRIVWNYRWNYFVWAFYNYFI